jgi:hypothetical protein
MRVVYGLSGDRGWHPITHMVRLLAELLEAELVLVPLSRVGNTWRRTVAMGPRRRGKDTCLVVAAAPDQLSTLLRRDYWLRGYEHVAGWVIDSFWVEKIPHWTRRRAHLDQLFVTDKEVVEPWGAATGVPVTWLPWGSDVLRLGSGEGDRPVDLQRLGRQPTGWEDDDETRRLCEVAGLQFGARPPMHDDATASQTGLMQYLARAKYTLSFTNLVSPAPYTHATREYLTGRWTDALASGATVAGIAPKVASARELLWPEATLELGTTDRAAGLEQIAAAVAAWTPDAAAANHRHALETLDWRHRFQTLAAALDVRPERLAAELDALAGLAAL